MLTAVVIAGTLLYVLMAVAGVVMHRLLAAGNSAGHAVVPGNPPPRPQTGRVLVPILSSRLSRWALWPLFAASVVAFFTPWGAFAAVAVFVQQGSTLCCMPGCAKPATHSATYVGGGSTETYRYCDEHIGSAPSKVYVAAKRSSGPEFPTEILRYAAYLAVAIMAIIVLGYWQRGFAHLREGRKNPPGQVEGKPASVEKGYLTCVLTGFGSVLVHPITWFALTDLLQGALVPRG